MTLSEEISIPSVRSIKMLLEPIEERLVNIENSLKNKLQQINQKMYYRNFDLKNNYGLSPNTIIKYRETGILPYTKLGDLYLYEVAAIERILDNNKISA
jgi:hypothetical protein